MLTEKKKSSARLHVRRARSAFTVEETPLEKDAIARQLQGLVTRGVSGSRRRCWLHGDQNGIPPLRSVRC
jgi:hypothetical protein